MAIQKIIFHALHPHTSRANAKQEWLLLLLLLLLLLFTMALPDALYNNIIILSLIHPLRVNFNPKS